MVKKVYETARNSHASCFICPSRKKNANKMTIRKKKLFQVSSKSIALVFRDHKIIIKKGAKCCSHHLDERNNLIPKLLERPIRWKTIKKDYQPFEIEMFEAWSKVTLASLEPEKSCCIFDRFKSVESLKDEDCLLVTGWDKETFIKISEYIKSIRNTEGRNKFELIALYRFYLRKVSFFVKLCFRLTSLILNLTL